MRIKQLLCMGFSLACFIAAGVCLIVDFALNQQITWAAYPLISIAYGVVVSLPLLAKKHEIALMICAFLLLLLPYLYLLSKITPVTDWFAPVGAPSAIVGSIAALLLFPLFRYARINARYKAAITVFLLGAIASPITNYYVDTYLGENPFHWTRFLSVFACIVAAAVLGIWGFTKPKTTPTAP